MMSGIGTDRLVVRSPITVWDDKKKAWVQKPTQCCWTRDGIRCPKKATERIDQGETHYPLCREHYQPAVLLFNDPEPHIAQGGDYD